MFELLGKEFTFTVDVSELPCGVNGALYFVAMDANGNSGNGNNAGPQFGTGYCDAQCPHDIKFIDGEANILDWQTTGSSTGSGKWGTCCPEMDIWEANKISTAYTAHPCGSGVLSQTKCETPETCGDNPDYRYQGWCDKDGCDLNAYRVGVKDFFGEGSDFTIDTSQPITVVTQFLTDDNGDLTEIRRKFIQNGTVHEQPMTALPGMEQQYDSITDEMCTNVK